MSSDLQWLLLRKNTSFLVRRNGVEFTREPNNLLNQNSYKYSGLANRRTLGLTPAADGKAVDFTVYKNSQAGRWKKGHTQTMKLANIRGTRACAKAIKKRTKGQKFRADLTQAAVARLYRIHMILKPKKAGVIKKPRRQRRAQKVAKVAKPAKPQPTKAA